MIDSEPSTGISQIRTYLITKRWQPEIVGQVAELWNHREYPDSTILVPTIETASDFSLRAGLLMQDLSKVEHRPIEAVSYDISTVFFDITNLKPTHPELIHDSIPVGAGQRLFESAEKLIEAAAAATIRRQGHFSRSMPLLARTHAKTLRIGHTRRGSYIVPILSPAYTSPVIPESEEPRLFALDVEETLFDRRVMTTFSGALGILEDIAVRAPRVPTQSEVMDSVQGGVSRELCEAVKIAISDPTVQSLDVSLRWSPSAPSPQDTPENISFPFESVEVISRISDQLKNAPQKREDVIYGLVRNLEQDRAGGRSRGGRAGVETFIDRRLRVVWMDLNEAAHQEAIHYYRNRTRVMVRGTLTTGHGRSWTMQVSSFSPDPSIPLFDVTA